MYQTWKLLLAISLVLALGCSRNQPNDNHAGTEKTIADADGHGHADDSTADSKPETLVLPEHLSTVLRAEMREIDAGMGRLLSHLALGDGPRAAEVAENIHNSFILKRNLSKQDLKQLLGLLPAKFIQMDRAFHAKAGKLAQDANSGDFTAAISLYGEMAQACVSCHAQYAAAQFPALATND